MRCGAMRILEEASACGDRFIGDDRLIRQQIAENGADFRRRKGAAWEYPGAAGY